MTFPLARDTTNAVVERVDFGEAAPINAAVELVCKRMSAGQFAAKDLPPALQRLSQLVYAPLARHLTNVSHLIVCLDGQLSRLPFEMLSVGNKLLIEEKTISYVTSGRGVVRIASLKPGVQSSKSLVIGNPDFDFNLVSAHPSNWVVQLAGVTPAPRSLKAGYLCPRFDPLAGAETEAKDVASRLANDTILLLGKDASKERLLPVASPRVLHLATHGFFFQD